MTERSKGKCRICRRVAMAVFGSIMFIEAIILVVSVNRFYVQQQDKVGDHAKMMIAAMLVDDNMRTAQQLFSHAEGLFEGAHISGVTVRPKTGGPTMTSDIMAGSLPPDVAVGMRSGSQSILSFFKDHTDFFFSPKQMGVPYYVGVRVDLAQLKNDTVNYVWRIALAVLLISAFVTLVTMLFLRRIILSPVLSLQAAMQKAAINPEDTKAKLQNGAANDELGEAIQLYNSMVDSLAEQKALLKDHNARLEHMVAARTGELDEALNSLRREVAAKERATKERDAIFNFPKSNPHPVMSIGEDNTITFANEAADILLQSWNCKQGELVPQPWRDVVNNVYQLNEVTEIDAQTAGRAFNLTFTPLRDKGGYVSIYGREVTETREASEKLQHLVYHDVLTGLPNRTLFMDRVRQYLSPAHEEPFALVVFDFRGYSQVNELVGPAAADELLQRASVLMADALEQSDTLARLDGDRFGALLVDVEEAGPAADRINRVMDCFKSPLEAAGQNIPLILQAGLAFAEKEQDAGRLIQNTEIALAQVKQQETGFAMRFFSDEMDKFVQTRNFVVSGLQKALDNGGFRLVYQPKVNLHTGRAESMEALVRWIDPLEGFVSPADFIPIAEQTGLIHKLGDWVLEEAVRQMSEWHEQGLNTLKVAVNLSTKQFAHDDLCGFVQKILDKYKLAPEFVELEITETTAMGNIEDNIAVMEQLNAIGVKLAIDDFGTGHSSLAYLSRFPVHRVKIDKAFVDEIALSGTGGDIAKAVVSMGHSLGLQVTAEGVEEDYQLKFLKNEGCDEIQGYFFSRPLPPEDLAKFMLEQPIRM